mmetsp:Transcript_37992/g.78942  ORF Transcript_37992/g.78942 Transcript_37992/m.78942 type:complete len:277 (+) Transcript_37992:2377-3207(+)
MILETIPGHRHGPVIRHVDTQQAIVGLHIDEQFRFFRSIPSQTFRFQENGGFVILTDIGKVIIIGIFGMVIPIFQRFVGQRHVETPHQEVFIIPFIEIQRDGSDAGFLLQIGKAGNHGHRSLIQVFSIIGIGHGNQGTIAIGQNGLDILTRIHHSPELRCRWLRAINEFVNGHLTFLEQTQKHPSLFGTNLHGSQIIMRWGVGIVGQLRIRGILIIHHENVSRVTHAVQIPLRIIVDNFFRRSHTRAISTVGLFRITLWGILLVQFRSVRNGNARL